MLDLNASIFLLQKLYPFLAFLVNKPCRVKSTGANGVCKVDRSCPKAQQDAESGIAPTICEILVSSIYVVCCEGKFHVGKY